MNAAGVFYLEGIDVSAICPRSVVLAEVTAWDAKGGSRHRIRGSSQGWWRFGHSLVFGFPFLTEFFSNRRWFCVRC